MVVTNDDAMAEKLYALHEHGRNKEGEMTGWGMNSRLDNLQAAFLNFFINIYDDQIVSKRRHIASIYQNRLQGNPHIHLPQHLILILTILMCSKTMRSSLIFAMSCNSIYQITALDH